MLQATKKIWLSWPTDSPEDDMDKFKNFKSRWTTEEPLFNNGIVEKGQTFDTEGVSLELPTGMEFTVEEFVGFILDGTFKLKEDQMMPFHVWYRFVKKLVEEHELTDSDYDLPTGILREWYDAGKTPQDAAHMIGHDGI